VIETHEHTDDFTTRRATLATPSTDSNSYGVVKVLSAPYLVPAVLVATSRK